MCRGALAPTQHRGSGTHLGVSEQEGDGHVLQAGLEQHFLDVIAPLSHAIVFRQFDLKALVLRPEGGRMRPVLSGYPPVPQTPRVLLPFQGPKLLFAHSVPSTWNTFPFGPSSSCLRMDPWTPPLRSPPGCL